MTQASRFNTLLSDSQVIIDQARSAAYRNINTLLVQRNWLLGKRIAEEDLGGEGRAEYGKQIIERLSGSLTEIYGQGFDYSSLYKFVRFYKCFPEILDAASPKSITLSWTHYRTLLQVDDEKYRTEGDNPTIGILLCADTDEDVARYSSLHDEDQLYMAKYLTYMPSQEQMKREIEQQKMVFALKSEK